MENSSFFYKNSYALIIISIGSLLLLLIKVVDMPNDKTINIILVYLILSLSSLKRSHAVSLSYLVAAIILPFAIQYMHPLSEPDAIKYFQETFQGGYYSEQKFAITVDHIPIVETVAYIFKFISFIYSSEDPVILVCGNYFFIIESAYLIATLLRDTYSLTKTNWVFVYLLIVCSPAINNTAPMFLKDCIFLFVLSLFVFLLNSSLRSRNFSFVNVFFLLLIFIVGMLIRPYLILILTVYSFVLYSSSRRYVICFYLLYIAGIIIFFGFDPVGYMFSIFGIIAIPNFMKVYNLINFPFLTLESLLYTLAVIFTIIISFKNGKKSYILIAVLMMSGVIIYSISLNRAISDSLYSEVNILNDDFSRKKIPFIPVVISALTLCFTRDNEIERE